MQVVKDSGLGDLGFLRCSVPSGLGFREDLALCCALKVALNPNLMHGYKFFLRCADLLSTERRKARCTKTLRPAYSYVTPYSPVKPLFHSYKPTLFLNPYMHQKSRLAVRPASPTQNLNPDP